MRIWHGLALAFALTAPLTLAAALPAAAAEYTVVLDKLKFGPLPAELHVGDVIIWQNKDILHHTATARDKSFDVDLPAGAEGRTTLEQAGSFDFYCRFHPGMTGTLVVVP
jgi:plastocyanin